MKKDKSIQFRINHDLWYALHLMKLQGKIKSISQLVADLLKGFVNREKEDGE